MRRTTTAALSSTIALGLLVSACGDDAPMDAEHSESVPDDGMHEMTGGHDEPTPVAEGARRVEVSASDFEFDPEEITVTEGEDVAIVLSSDDLLHDFTVDEIDVHVAADRGESAEGGLRAAEAGEYTYYCTVSGHREAGMEGTLVVEQR